jgi:hypothetical protein
MDPAPAGTVLACPSAGRVEVSFDPSGTVALVAGGGPLVYGAVATRVVDRACRSVGRLHRVPTGALRERKRAATLPCILPRSARYELHAIGSAGRGPGSAVAVLDGGLRRVLLLVVLEHASRGSSLRPLMSDRLTTVARFRPPGRRLAARARTRRFPRRCAGTLRTKVLVLTT